jgi:hypothetical protein
MVTCSTVFGFGLEEEVEGGVFKVVGIVALDCETGLVEGVVAFDEGSDGFGDVGFIEL